MNSLPKSKPALLTLAFLFAGIFFLSGCNTLRGLGQDTEEAGQEIQDATR